MSIVIKGSEPFDIMIASNIANCQTANIKFKNISFRCETIEDADGTVFVKMPSAQPEWIPCSERLPENSDTVLITHRGGVSVGWYNGRYWERGANTKHRPLQTVIAWMPLPTPWEGGQDG